MTLDDTSDTPMRAVIGYDSGKTLMARGPQALLRFKDVSITADIMVKDETNAKTQLPTLINVLKSSYDEIRSSKHVVKKQVLRNINGVFKPGTITLVLGQPGSGKSSLMKLLSGHHPSQKNVTFE
ncbi:ATP-binding cassette (ABC) Superfamily, partial [Phytophthora palmivora]